jgi:hypothetical protein
MVEELTPLHRIADPEEIAAAVVYLASPAGVFLTGKVLEVDGGTGVPAVDFGLPGLWGSASDPSTGLTPRWAGIFENGRSENQTGAKCRLPGSPLSNP